MDSHHHNLCDVNPKKVDQSLKTSNDINTGNHEKGHTAWVHAGRFELHCSIRKLMYGHSGKLHIDSTMIFH